MHLLGVEVARALDVDGAALMQDRPGEVVAAADVIEVDDRVGGVLRAELVVDHLLQRVPHHRAVGPDDALGLAGRAGREDDLVRVVELAGSRVGRSAEDDAQHLLVGEVGRRRRRARSTVRRSRQLARAAQLEDRPQEAVLDEDRPRRRAAQQVRQLAGAQAPVERHHDRARRRDPHLDLDELEPVGAEHARPGPSPRCRARRARWRRGGARRAARRRCACGPRRRSPSWRGPARRARTGGAASAVPARGLR